MAISIYDQAIVPLTRMLHNLDATVAKAEEHVASTGIDPDAILHARLYPDMLTFIQQIRVASDSARGAAARLSGNERPVWSDDEQTFAEARDRIQRTVQYLSEFRPEQFEGAETRQVILALSTRTVDLPGKEYLLHFVIPNFYFHVAVAHAILRHTGVQIGKADYLGAGG